MSTGSSRHILTLLPKMPISVVDVPLRHYGLAQGVTRNNIAYIKLHGGPDIGLAMVRYQQEASPQILVAHMASHHDRPDYMAQFLISSFRSAVAGEQVAYVLHDGTEKNAKFALAMAAEFKRRSCKVMASDGNLQGWAISIENGQLVKLQPTAPVYEPSDYTQRLIDACIQGRTYMDDIPLESYFDLRQDDVSFLNRMKPLEPSR